MFSIESTFHVTSPERQPRSSGFIEEADYINEAAPLERKKFTPDSARQVKSRSGCQQCKKRKVKCDERQPICTRCLARGDTCTGNFRCDIWQIERPWVCHANGNQVKPILEDDLIRYWYSTACFNMALFPPPVNPLAHHISPLLSRSKALRHTLNVISEAHRHQFSQVQSRTILVERGQALVSLQSEMRGLLTASHSDILLRAAALSSLMLCISSGWLDSTGRDFGIDFLWGSREMVSLMVSHEPEDPVIFYVVGLFVYWECFSAYLMHSSKQKPSDERILAQLQNPPFYNTINPVTGIATAMFPLLTEIGQYYRFVVDNRCAPISCHQTFKQRLRDFLLPGGHDSRPYLKSLAEAYRSIGFIMLYQARSVMTALDEHEELFKLHHVLKITEMTKEITTGNQLLNWEGPLLLIAGSELTAEYHEERELIKKAGEHLASWTRVKTYSQALQLVQDIWSLRDQGSKITWLEKMVLRDLALVVG